jgi:transposase InsO family protein
MNSRREYIRAMKDRYRAAKAKKDKSRLLDEVVAVTGYHRKYAIRLLGASDKPIRPRKRRRRKRRYTKCLSVIALCWEALDYCCAERLHPRLVPLTEQLIRHRVVYPDREVLDELETISLSTLARRLREMPSPKARMVPRPRAGSLIKSKVPIGRYEWDEARPGALEADVVEHNGGVVSGQYVCTLSVTDVVTGWSQRRAARGRGQAGIHEALSLILDQWPYPCWGLHADNGSEFLAGHVQRFVAQRGLDHTRSRPYKKNDSAHVEQRNRFVREMVGYDRYDTPEALQWLNKVYELMDLYANLVLPTMKLVDKKRSKGKVRKTYDTPRPPLERAIEHGVISAAEQARLESMAAEINPLELHRELERLIRQGPEGVGDHLKAAAGAR